MRAAGVLCAAAIAATAAAAGAVALGRLAPPAARKPPPAPTAKPAAGQPAAPALTLRTPAVLRQFAVNGLVVPLLGLDAPLRWTALNLPQVCEEGTRVFVDGRPLEAEHAVPLGAFRLRWEMTGCDLFNIDGEALSGTWIVDVVRTPERLSATAQPVGAWVSAPGGGQAVAGEFSGTLMLDEAGDGGDAERHGLARAGPAQPPGTGRAARRAHNRGHRQRPVPAPRGPVRCGSSSPATSASRATPASRSTSPPATRAGAGAPPGGSSR